MKLIAIDENAFHVGVDGEIFFVRAQSTLSWIPFRVPPRFSKPEISTTSAAIWRGLGLVVLKDAEARGSLPFNQYHTNKSWGPFRG